MPRIQDLDFGGWIQSIIRAFISGGASAFTAGGVVGVVDPKDFYIGSAKSFKLMGGVFVVSGVFSVANFLSKDPWPEVKTTIKTSTIVHHEYPPTTVVKTVEQTTFSPPEKSDEK